MIIWLRQSVGGKEYSNETKKSISHIAVVSGRGGSRNKYRYLMPGKGWICYEMIMNRRNFLGASLLGLTGLAAGPAWAVSATPNKVDLLQKARIALAKHQASLLHTDLIGIADYSLHSARPRFHLVNMESGKITSLLVAHGKGSDRKHTGWLQQFSNEPGSEASSSGAYVTAKTYVGKHGLSRRLQGLEPSNDMAETRAIVIHGAWYADQDMVRKYGKLGRSQGCFAFSENDLGQVLEKLGTGRLLYTGKD